MSLKPISINILLNKIWRHMTIWLWLDFSFVYLLENQGHQIAVWISNLKHVFLPLNEWAFIPSCRLTDMIKLKACFNATPFPSMTQGRKWKMHSQREMWRISPHLGRVLCILTSCSNYVFPEKPGLSFYFPGWKHLGSQKVWQELRGQCITCCCLLHPRASYHQSSFMESAGWRPDL